MDLDRRVEKLEIELAHQQRTVDQLNEVIAEQSMELLRQSRKFERLLGQFKEIERKLPAAPTLGEERDLIDEKPPHY